MYLQKLSLSSSIIYTVHICNARNKFMVFQNVNKLPPEKAETVSLPAPVLHSTIREAGASATAAQRITTSTANIVVD
jgi:hypothetical protein